MVLVEIFNKRVCEEVVFRRYRTALASSPVHILLLPSKAHVVISKAQYDLYTIPSCFSYRKIQTLFTRKKYQIFRKKHGQRISKLGHKILRLKENLNKTKQRTSKSET